MRRQTLAFGLRVGETEVAGLSPQPRAAAAPRTRWPLGNRFCSPPDSTELKAKTGGSRVSMQFKPLPASLALMICVALDTVVACP